MIQHHFDINKFKPFPTSSGINGDSTGNYEGRVVRVFRYNIEMFKSILQFSIELDLLIKSDLFYEDDKLLVIEHERLENITYFTEWTKKQKLIAAKAIVELQSELVKKGFYLNDPHTFNITFKYSQPIYFDFGSIKKGHVKPAWWFIKGFCGWTEMDYWDTILRINVIQKIFIMTAMSLSKSPYEYLLKKLSKFEIGFFEEKLIDAIKTKSFYGKIIRKFISRLPGIFTNFSNWSDYEQKNPELNFDIARNKNILEIFKSNKPKKVLDIGANRGAYSFLALKNGAEEVIAIDLDNFSLDFLMDEVKKYNQNITIAKVNIMDYPDRPGHYKSYLPAHDRLNSDFTICLAVVHHVCYFGNYSFEEFAERINKFSKKTLFIEFVPNDDIHLTGNTYKGKDRSWYTLDNFISAIKKWFPKEHEIFDSTPSPRLLIKFSK